jgi:tetratricopeptide (TPR) repeat protein
VAKAKKAVKKTVASKKKSAPGSKPRPAARRVAKTAGAKASAKKTVKEKPAPKRAVKKATAKKAPGKKAAASRPATKKVAVKARAVRKAHGKANPVNSEPVNKKVKLSSTGGAVQAQQKIYAEGVDLLNARKYSQAASRFSKAIEGPDVALKHSATVYLRICEQRMQSEPEPKTVEDRYNAAVAFINDRRLEDADRLLRLALKQDPKGAHLHFALGVAATLSGDIPAAISSIERAIELDPQSRILAQRDSDLAALRSNPAAARLFASDSDDEVA